ncbi:MAG: TIGR03790 family protein [Polyangiaceae bacterium]|nr:TIGR03790 family protein [Polyangiaceae bacterium]
MPPSVRLPRESLGASELGVVVNAGDPQSIAVGSYYAAARGIPADHIVNVLLPVADVVSQQDFATAKAIVDAALGPEIQGLVLTWTRPYRADCMSITSAFALGFDPAYCSQPCNGTAPVAYFDSPSLAPFTDHGIRPAMMLAAATEAGAVALVDRGVASDQTFPLGDGVLVRTTDTARSVRWSAFETTVADWSYPGGLALEYLDNSTGAGSDHVDNRTNLLFYFTGLADVPAIATNTYRPGAVADHLTSYGGQVPTSGQMSVVAWLEAGVTGSYGTVVEPCNYTQKFPDTRVLLPHYFRGATLLEAYWKSVAWPGEGLFVGEPLARPWGSTVSFAAGTLSIRTTTLVPGTTYELRAATSAAGPYVPVLGNITVPHLEVTTVTLENATAPYYELGAVGG